MIYFLLFDTQIPPHYCWPNVKDKNDMYYWLHWQKLLLLWRDCKCTYIDHSENDTSYYLYCLPVRLVKVSQKLVAALLTLHLFFSVVSIFVNYLLTLLTGCIPSVVIVTWCTAVPCHLLSHVLTNCLSEDQIVESLCEVTYCRVGVATLPNQNFLTAWIEHTLVCGLALSRRSSIYKGCNTNGEF